MGSGNVRTYAAQTAPTRPGAASGPATRSLVPLHGGRFHPTIVTPQLPATTGINHYWDYTESPIGGVGRYMVNTGTGNVLLQADDMAIPHKGIELAMRRTYNSQSYHDYAGRDGSQPSNYGQGWTSNLDAHIAWIYDANGISTHNISVYDGDGARYDYTYNAGTNTYMPPPGQFAQLTYDGNYYFHWTKKSGTVYYFHNPTLGQGWDGKAGRIKFIYGRNSNTNLNFVYYFDANQPVTFEHLSQITVTADDGERILLTFANFGPGNARLLQSLTRPDSNVVTYNYDISGGLSQVLQPGHGSPTSTLEQDYAYNYPAPGVHYLSWVSDPNWNASGQTAGQSIWFTFDLTGQTAVPAATTPALYPVTAVRSYGFINPTVAIPGAYTAPNGHVQPDQPATYTQSTFATVLYTYTMGAQSVRGGVSSWSTDVQDYDGHETTYYIENVYRVYRTFERDEVPAVGPPLSYNQTWNGSDELTSETDPNNNATSYAYDTNGNTTMVQKPLVQSIITSDQNGSPISPVTVGWAPQSRYFYDASNNLTYYCDAFYMYYHQGDQCTGYAVGITWLSWVPKSYELFGELTSITTPIGYSKNITYDSTYQGGGLDYGLPTQVSWGGTFNQPDGSTRNPTQLFTYDASGNLICYNKLGTDRSATSGWWILGYDTANHLISSADPDDSSTSGCGKTGGGIAGSYIVTRMQYAPDGTLTQSQSPSEYDANVWTGFTYDSDGNELTETHHYNYPTSAAGTAQKWYDGADRLVEVMMPRDPDRDYYKDQGTLYPWLTRYIYDLSQSAMPSPNPNRPTTLNGVTLPAYGNLAKTVEWLPPVYDQQSGIAWTDVRGTSFDPLDRVVSSYETAFGFSPKSTNTYDENGYRGLLTTVANGLTPTHQTITKAYRADGMLKDEQFGGPNAEPERQTYYDPDGRVTQLWSQTYGAELFAYDLNSRKIQMVEPQNLDARATITYTYYPDSTRKTLSVSSTALTETSLFGYSYRSDGRVKTQAVHSDYTAPFRWTYTPGGRETGQTDPLTGGIVTSFPKDDGNGGHYYMPYTGNPMALVGTAITYDSRGNIASMQVPMQGQYQNFSHDAEGEVTGFDGYMPLLDHSVYPRQTNNYTTRGEAASLSFTSSNQHDIWYPYGAKFANGFAVTGPFDPRSNMLLGRADVLGFGWSDSYAYNYDPAGRQTTSSSSLTYNDPILGPRTDNNTYARAYDAENHVATTTAPFQNGYWGTSYPYIVNGDCGTVNTVQYPNTLTYGWGADGHLLTRTATTTNPPSMASTSLHWDGDDILFTSDAGQLRDLKVGKLGRASPTAVVEVTDRDWTGAVVMSHTRSGSTGYWFSAWRPSTPNHNFKLTTCGYFKYPSDSPHFTAPASDQSVRSPLDANVSGFRAPGLDGWSDGINTFQGVRTYDSQMAQWTTPDAYAGDVHDPMSQKPYMWNRNNAFEYSDPSGYCPMCLLWIAFVFLAMHPEIAEELTSPMPGASSTAAAAKAALAMARNSALVARGSINVIQLNRLSSAAAVRSLRQVFGGKSETFETMAGSRRVADNVAMVSGKKVAQEAKVGDVGHGSDVMNQVAADAELLSSGQVDKVQWYFFGNGPDATLGKALHDANFDVLVMPSSPGWQVPVGEL
jgi:YD repeat-containing protein